jgi:alkyl sulfatase BDS1-like metallo-beta-lactamase superfamily hydrolase
MEYDGGNNMKKCLALLITAVMLSCTVGCNNEAEEEQVDILEKLELNTDSKDATETTVKINSEVYSLLDFDDKTEWEFANKGLIDAPEKLEIKDSEGNVVWSQEAYAFLEDYDKAPDTVNPSLWENSKNNHAYGLFKVTDGIYQVRGYDMANLTLIESDNGWIVFDPLMSVECTKAAMDLAEKNLGERPVKAVIISHSHVDHFGGIGGVISAEEVADVNLSLSEQLASGKIPVIVPEGFEAHAVSENIYAGVAMQRRAAYQYGVYLAPSIKSTLAMGIGMGQSTGTLSYISPSYEIKETGESYVIDGVKLEFQMTPGTEAPTEMNTWLPDKKALWVAENCTGTLHNLYTLRGAQIRDGSAWAKYICETIALYGAEAEVTFQSHNWPHWGNEVLNEYLENTAAVYQYINDKTLEYINQGYTSDEISNMIELPKEHAKNWYTRQYYGTVAHNSKAVYQKYMGWYDANPVNLNPLTPSESAKKWVEYLGDTDRVLEMAKADYDKGEYQWVAEITNVIVYAEPDNTAARLLCADALEQLGYQAESGTWRNAYLTAAYELRDLREPDGEISIQSGVMLANISADNIFDYIGIALDKEAMADKDITVNVVLTDLNRQYMLKFKNGVLLKYEGTLSDEADVTIKTVRKALLLMMGGSFEQFSEKAVIEGDKEQLKLIMSNLNRLSIENADRFFNIIEP